MADTLPNVPVPADTWVNLYTATGIAVGTQITVFNLNDTNVRLHVGATAPTDAGETEGYTLLTAFGNSTNQSGDSGAWAWSSTNTLVNVRRA